MKAIKVAGKVVGWIVGGYLILNTLFWAWVRVGYNCCELQNAMDDDRIQHKILYANHRVTEDAKYGWSLYLYDIKMLFGCIAEAIKDAF